MKRNALIFTLFMTCFMKVIAQPQFPFTASQANPVLEHGAPGAWDAAGMIDPDIVFDNGTYYLFYTGFETSGQGAIGYATSSDGYNFIKVTVSDPVFASDGTGFDAWLVSDPVIIKEGNLWVMYYGARQYAGPGPGPSIGKATANDLAGPWTREEDAILTVGSPGEWDSHFVIPNTILYTESGMVMYYSGAASLAGDWYMGMAYNNGSGWIKYDDPSTNVPPYAESDPVLITGEPGAWDSHIASFGYVNKIASGFEMFYLGETTSSAGLGYAISTDGIIWEKSPDNPFYTYLDDPFAASNNLYVLELPAVYITNDTYRMYYDYGTGSGTGYIGMATAPTLPQIIHVPADQPTIQAGIDIATTGDTVLVAEGTYYENINFLGKAITVASHFILDADTSHINNTIIDGSQPAHPDSASVVMFISGEDTTSIISGFTITGGTGTNYQYWNQIVGGGILVLNSGAKIAHNKITGNHLNNSLGTGGSGIFSMSVNEDHLVIAEHNRIFDNSGTSAEIAYAGGAFFANNNIIRYNHILGNHCYSSNVQANGGGLFVYQVGSSINTQIINNVIKFNHLEGYEGNGAGIALFNVADADISNNEISQNSIDVANYGGGGALMTQHSGLQIQLNIQSNLISNNSIEGGYVCGAGIWLYGSGAQISDNLISNNTIVSNMDYWLGAGVRIFEPNYPVTIRNNEFSNNFGPVAATGGGGGLSIEDAYNIPVIVDANAFTSNTAYNGGGMFERSAWNLHCTNNLFAENFAYRGAGLTLFHPNTSIQPEDHLPMIINNTFYNNTATNDAGAFRMSGDQVAPKIYNSIFWNNDAPMGKDIYNWTSLDVEVYYSDINPANITGPWTGSDNINEDPLFDLSGPHPYALMPNSPCIDAGTPDTTGLCLPDCDIIGCCRIWDGDGNGVAVIDMGAYEFGAPLISGTPQPEIHNPKSEISAYPNPFHSSITIEFELKAKTQVTLEVYNHMGQQVAKLLNESKAPGQHQLSWNAAHLPPGLYFLRLQAGNEVRTGKIIKQ